LEIMKKLLFIAAFAAGGVCAFGQAPAYVDHQVLVKSTSALKLPAGATIKKSWSKIGWQLVQLPASLSVSKGMYYFSTQRGVQKVEPNLMRWTTRTVSDPFFSQQYAMTKIKAPQAWDLGTGDPSVIVAVLDSGFELSHIDMAGKFVQGFDFEDNDTDPTWVSSPHGVETAGCVAAATDNGIGIAAIGFNCKIMPLRVGNAGIAVSNSISGMMYAADNGAKVINMSYGGPGTTQAEQDAVNYAWNKGPVVIASAGNAGDTVKNYPAACDHVISVAASDQNDQRAGFSTFGDWVHVAAPGVAVLTTAPNNSYGPADGTSFSSPITAGLAGLLFAFAAPNTTNAQIVTAIESTCDPVGNWVQKGRINAFAAMQTLQQQQAPPVEIGPASIQTTFGTYFFGDVTTVSASDDIYYQIGSSMLGLLGQAATAELTYTVPTDATQISVSLEAIAGIAGGTSNVWMWNWNSGQYELIGSAPIQSSGNDAKTFTVQPANLSRYIGGGGAVKVLVRGHFPYKPLGFAPPLPFTYRIDLAELLVRSPN
jgi:thermitase